VSTRRRYKSDPPAVNVGPAPAPAPPAAPEPTSEGDDANPLQRAYDAARHAEELQRQPARAADVHAHIDSLPISGHKKAFLHANPALAQAPLSHVMAHHYQLALHSGVPDDSEFMNQTVLQGVQRDIAHHHALKALTSADARPTAANAQAHEDAGESAAELMREAEGHQAAWLAENPPPAPPQKRRSIPMSAPVSRDFSAVSGSRQQENTLRADERQIARVSFPHLSPLQAEYAYLQNKKRMMATKADGRIQGDG
jgi:hypothetical protein